MCKPSFFLSHTHPCSYLPGQTARTLVVDPDFPMDPMIYQELIDRGFRRSGNHVYRPLCSDCRACIPLRLPVTEFHPRRSQRRCWQQGRDQFQVHTLPAGCDPQHFELFRRYTRERHPGAGMDETSAAGYLAFLTADWADTRFYEFRLQGELVAIAATDLLPNGLSAVYTFFDPGLARLSPGVFALLWQIEETKRLALPWLYLGYWIADCRKMSYKDQYRPVEAWTGLEWKRFAAGTPVLFKDLI